MGEQPVIEVPAEVKPEPVEAPAPVATVIPMPEPVKPAEGFRQSIKRLRQQKEAQLRLF
jgi:hypothetical protein